MALSLHGKKICLPLKNSLGNSWNSCETLASVESMLAHMSL